MSDDDLTSGSILEQLEALDADEGQLARNFIDDDLEELQRQAQHLRSSHEEAVAIGRRAGHAPVLLYAAMEFMFPPSCQASNGLFEGNFADCTFGRGGHSRAILSRITDSSRLFAFDVDPTAIEAGRVLERMDSRFNIFHEPYGTLEETLPDVALHAAVLDIGISNPQVDRRARGFSLQDLDGVGPPNRPLDLRMNSEAGISAAEWLQEVSVEELAWVLRKYGDEHDNVILSERMAQAILDDQALNGPYESMKRFAEVVARARQLCDDVDDFEHPVLGRDHPAKLSVQAIRLFLNHELEQLEDALTVIFRRLEQGGRCVVSAFKWREAEIIQEFLLRHEDPDPAARKGLGARRLRELYPLVGTDLDYGVRLISKPIKASNYEVNKNNRARSGSLYVMEKVPRTSRMVKARPRLERNRVREPSRPPLVGGAGDEEG